MISFVFTNNHLNQILRGRPIQMKLLRIGVIPGSQGTSKDHTLAIGEKHLCSTAGACRFFLVLF